MSRPPRPEADHPIRRELVAGEHGLDYLPLDFDDLVALAARVGGGEVSPGVGDPTHTLYELSALVSHVLAVHQDHYASEAFLGTATTTRSLVKHGRRLGYEPSPGSTATGFLEVAVKAELAGELPSGIVAATSPRGGAMAEDFETLTARRVDAAWNVLEVRAADRERVITVTSTATTLRLVGTNLGLRAGEPAILVGPMSATGLDIIAVEETHDETVVTLSRALGVALGPANDPAGYRVLAGPSVESRLFGWDANATLFPSTALETATTYSPPVPVTNITHGYAQPPGVTTSDIFLSRTLDEQLGGQLVLVSEGSQRHVLTVDLGTPQADVGVRFVRGGSRQELDHVTVTGTTVTPVMKDVLDERAIAGTVTRLRLGVTRAQLGVRAVLFGLWRITASLVARERSTAIVAPSTDLYLAGEHTLEPSMLVALRTRDGGSAQIVELAEVEVGGGETRIRYLEVTPAPHPWELGNLVVLGNLVRVVHGTTRDEVLGESDGVTPFQRFKLKKTPLGYLASSDGIVPDIEVRVGGVRWERVVDLGEIDAARQYKLERTHDDTVWVRFGDGKIGAIPPAGRNNVSARYRVGLGPGGNVEAGRIARLSKNHPLVDRVTNPVATSGGTDPANREDVRTHATRYIRTFDRAVSLRDHADLALLFPGVARAAARLVDGAIELTVATLAGESLVNRTELFAQLDARRDTALRLVPRDPVAVPVAIRVYIEHDDAFLQRDVESAIRAALHGAALEAPGMFTFAARDLGQAAHASEVHAALSRVPGVTFAQLLRFDLAPGTGLRDVLQPHPHQWLRLDPNDFAFGAGEEADLD